MPLLENFEKQGNDLFKHRGTLPLIIVFIALVLVYMSRNYFDAFIYSTWFRWYEVFCLAVSLFGLFIRVITIGHAPKGTSGRNKDRQIADALNTTGIYSTVRHPLYLGNFFMWLGLTIMTFHFWFVIVVCLLYWIYYERIMFAEEQFLRKKYGESYSLWASQTPTFIPNLHLWKKAYSKFDYKKVLRQEKNGLFAVFLLFFLVDFMRQVDHLRSYFREEGYWAAGVVFGLFAYLLLKLLKYKTSLLADVESK